MKSITLIIILVFFLKCINIKAQEENNSIMFEAAYTGDVVSNYKGGIKTGTLYLGLINLTATINSKSAG